MPAKRSIIEINHVRLKGVEDAINRLAAAVERLLLEAYGVRMQPSPVPERDESEVLYSTDSDHLRQELIDLREHRPPEGVVEG